MSFPNAENGIKKMFVAEILALIAAVVLLVSAIVTFGSGAVLSQDSGVSEAAYETATTIGLISVILFLASGTALLVGYVLKLVGLKQAGHDEDKFVSAFALEILSLILMIGYGVFNSINTIVANISYSVATIFEIIAIILVLQGIMNLAIALNNENVLSQTRRVANIIFVVYVLRFIAYFLSAVFGTFNISIDVLTSILLIASYVFAVVQYITYLVLLGKTKKMLKED